MKLGENILRFLEIIIFVGFFSIFFITPIYADTHTISGTVSESSGIVVEGTTVIYDTQPGTAETADPITPVTKGKIAVH